MLFTLITLCLFDFSEVVGATQEKDDDKAEQTENLDAAPKIQFDELLYDFGNAYQNSTVKHSFTFKNVGTDNLRVGLQNPGRFTWIFAPAKAIPPGEKGEIKVRFNTDGKRGLQRESFNVTTNDPDQPLIRLKIIVNIQVILAPNPDQLSFGPLKVEAQSKPQYISLIGIDGKTTKIKSVESSDEHIKAEKILSNSESGREEKIKVTILPGMIVGNFSEIIVIHTDHKKIKKLAVPISGKVVGNISVIPRYMSLFQIGQRLSGGVSLRATHGKAFNILQVKSTEPNLALKVETVKKGFLYNIRASAKKGHFTVPAKNRKITIITDYKCQEKIVLPVKLR